MSSQALATLPDIGSAALPAVYSRAKAALAQCAQVDECKTWADKAAALASYAKQSGDRSLQTLAIRIQARAIRRCGELLKTFQAPGGRPAKTSTGTRTSSQRQAADSAGLSKYQEVTAVRVANVPEEAFEAAVESETPPSVTELATRATMRRIAKESARPGFVEATQALAAIGRLAEFCAAHDPLFVAGGLTPHDDLTQLQAHALIIHPWLDRFIARVTETQGRGPDDDT